VARDRKRAKQRRARRGAAAAQPTRTRRSPVGEVERADLPGALEHAGGEVDEFDAALVAGAGGVPASPTTDLDAEEESAQLESPADTKAEPADTEAKVDNNVVDTELEPDPIADSPERLSEHEVEVEAEAEGDLSEDQLQELPRRADGRRAATPEQASGAPVRGGNRVVGFLRASWAELQRVQWPDRRQVFQATAVVMGFVAIAGVYLGVADTVAKEIVEFIL
jgi:preprotein translocase subunit SecE